MPSSVADLVFCWHHWLGKHNSDVENLVLGCLLWIIWTKRNRRFFEDIEKSLAQLLDLCQRTLFDWSRCWGLVDCSTLMDFLLSLRIVYCFFVTLCFCFFFVLYHELCVSFVLFLFLIIFPYYLAKKKKGNLSVAPKPSFPQRGRV